MHVYRIGKRRCKPLWHSAMQQTLPGTNVVRLPDQRQSEPSLQNRSGSFIQIGSAEKIMSVADLEVEMQASFCFPKHAHTFSVRYDHSTARIIKI